MKIIIPMAGRGSRLRPHTLTTPKPLLAVGGKPIVQRLVEDIVGICKKQVDEIAYIIGDFGKEIEDQLIKIAKDLGSKGTIYHQKEPLGTAHAILCAQESLKGNCVIAFADTLFKADFNLDSTKDGIIWVSQIEDPSSFGVVKVDQKNIITDFVEKPEVFVSDLAIIGIYYFKDGDYLKKELQYLLDNNIKDKGEYQLTNALENMKNKGINFSTGKVIEWLDCGNKNATVYTNQRILKFNGNQVDKLTNIDNSEIIEPCFIAENVMIKNSKIGPYVAIQKNTIIENSNISNSIIQSNTHIKDGHLVDSMIGSNVIYKSNKTKQNISIGDYTEVRNA
jgi:glucose-1-phosphate thymidylyltransferase